MRIPEVDFEFQLYPFNIPPKQSTINEGAKNNKEMFAGRMTREDISKAQKLSRECLAQDYKNCGY